MKDELIRIKEEAISDINGTNRLDDLENVRRWGNYPKKKGQLLVA